MAPAQREFARVTFAARFLLCDILVRPPAEWTVFRARGRSTMLDRARVGAASSVDRLRARPRSKSDGPFLSPSPPTTRPSARNQTDPSSLRPSFPQTALQAGVWGRKRRGRLRMWRRQPWVQACEAVGRGGDRGGEERKQHGGEDGTVRAHLRDSWRISLRRYIVTSRWRHHK